MITEIQDSQGGTNNLIGSSDGFITFTMTAGSYFPKYGGMLTIFLPDWYGPGTEPVFSYKDPNITTCTSPNLYIEIQGTNEIEFYHKMSI